MTVVKICGIKSTADAIAAAQAGAEYLGFNFYPASPRAITPQACRNLVADLPARYRRVIKVGVFVNHPIEEVEQIVALCALDYVQFSGDEKPDEVSRFPGRAFKALKPRDAVELNALVGLYGPASTATPAFLIDANANGAYGGTGKLADWNLAGELAERRSIFLAGGLNPENVGDAIRQACPWGVDVASGVERSPGEKDPDLIRDFIRAVRIADAA